MVNQEFPLVSVVIVNFNGFRYVKECIDSVLLSKYSNLEIIVIDNGSIDKSASYLSQISNDCEFIKVIINSFNYGPAYARNQGIKKATGKYIAFLDNDTIVKEDWLLMPIHFFESDNFLGGCQCKLIIEGTNLIDCVGEYIGQNGFLVPVVIPGDEEDCGQHNEYNEVFAAKSAGMIIRTNVLELIDGFDQDYFIYMEESDLCWRIWQLGYSIISIPDSIVFHKFGTSSIILSEEINFLVKYHGTKNYILTLLKNLETKNLIIMLPIHLSLWIGLAGFFLLKGQNKSCVWIFRGILWNISNINLTLSKRRRIQAIRKSHDDEIFKKVMKRESFSYYLKKIQRTKKIGNANGWNKNE